MRDINDNFSHDNSRAKFKQRIAGGAVLIIVLAIFLPFIFSHSHVAPPDAAQTAQTAGGTNNAAQTGAAPVQPEAAASTAAPVPAAAPVKSQADQNQPQSQPEASAPIPGARTAPASTTAVMALTSPDQKEEQSMRSDQPGLTPSQSESSPPVASGAAPPQQQKQRAPSAAPAPSAPPSSSVAPNPSVAQAKWLLQVGSFSQASYAEHLASQLRAHGLRVYTKREQNHLVHVYVGPLASEEEAQKIQREMRSEFQLHALVREKRA